MYSVIFMMFSSTFSQFSSMKLNLKPKNTNLEKFLTRTCASCSFEEKVSSVLFVPVVLHKIFVEEEKILLRSIKC